MRNVENLAAVQSHLLLGSSLLAEVAPALSTTDARVANAAELRAMVDARVVPETNMVVLEARGPEPEALATILQTWLETYLARHASASAQAAESTDEALDERLRGLEQKVIEKRAELARFREEHDIASMGRDENQALARLKGLTESLNRASEEAVAAEARLVAVEQAIAEGRPVGQDRDERALANLETRLSELREELEALEQQYTDRYLSLDPGVRTLREKIGKLEDSIATKRIEMADIARSEAEQDLLSAREAMRSLEADLAGYEQRAAAFTTRFAELESLQEDLLQLETLQREAQAEIVQQDVSGNTSRPEVTVLEPPSLPHRPVGPDYLRDALLGIGGSTLVALLAILVYALATRPPASMRPIQTVVYSSGVAERLAAPDPRRLEAPPPLLGAAEPQLRELSPGQVSAMLAVCDAPTRAAVHALVSGLSVDELLALRWGQVKLEEGRLELTGAVPRKVVLSAAACDGLQQLAYAGATPATPVWHDRNEGCLTRNALDAMLSAAAYRANVDAAGSVGAETLRHTYIAFLVRQGLALDALPAVVGPLTGAAAELYRSLAPADGGGKPQAEVELGYPVHA